MPGTHPSGSGVARVRLPHKGGGVAATALVVLCVAGAKRFA